MKLKIKRECGYEVIEQVDDEGNIVQSYDETFYPNDTLDGDIEDDCGDYINFLLTSSFRGPRCFFKIAQIIEESTAS